MPRRRVGCPQVEALPRWATIPHPNGSPSTQLDLQHDWLKRTLDAMATSPLRTHIRFGLETRCIAPLVRLSVARIYGFDARRYPSWYTLFGIGRDGQRLKNRDVHGYRHTGTGRVRRCCRSTTNRRLLRRDVHPRGARNGQGVLPQRASRSVSPDALRQPISYTKIITRTRLDARSSRHSGSQPRYELDVLHHAKGILLAFYGNGHPRNHHQVHNLCPKPPRLAATHHASDAAPGYWISHGAVRWHLGAHHGLQEGKSHHLGYHRPLRQAHQVRCLTANYGHVRGVSHHPRVGVSLRAPGADPIGPRAPVHVELLHRCDENAWHWNGSHHGVSSPNEWASWTVKPYHGYSAETLRRRRPITMGWTTPGNHHGM